MGGFARGRRKAEGGRRKAEGCGLRVAGCGLRVVGCGLRVVGGRRERASQKALSSLHVALALIRDVRPDQRLPRCRGSRLRSRQRRFTWPHSTSRLGSRLRRRSRPPGPGWAAARRTTRRRSPGRPRQPRGWSISSCDIHLLSGFYRSAKRHAPPTGRVFPPASRVLPGANEASRRPGG